ncbi:MAG: serine/threonine-protein phosphatase [Clostridiales bacterium]|nr:serine/threonine-protein phosphatase [Clostridiales bacterium]HOC08987.1 protein phosphatase 2C domain-containing protein [Bacillota bacterium]
MLIVSAIVDTGLVRQKNDDRILLDDKVYSTGEYSHAVRGYRYLAAVADGVGGEGFGEEAAQTALECIAGIGGQEITETMLSDVISKANEAVMGKQAEDLARARMATTLAGVYIDGDDLITFNVGDSRVYRIRDGLMMRLTHDHSEVQELLDHGYIDEAEAMNHPKRSIITRFIGHPQLCLPDIVKYEGKFLPGDLLLLCSDGLTDQLEEEEIENIMDVEGVSLQLRAWQLIHLTHEKGGFDNTSIILIHKNGGTDRYDG